jgi:formylglycine-generating enzyme required for sulfatase activity
LQVAENLMDQAYRQLHNEPLEVWNDGYDLHAPVGRFRANGFGLYDIGGNVMEWCVQSLGDDALAASTLDSRQQLPRDAQLGAVRGGGYMTPSFYARSANRFLDSVDFRNGYLGVRPVRRLESE